MKQLGNTEAVGTAIQVSWRVTVWLWAGVVDVLWPVPALSDLAESVTH